MFPHRSVPTFEHFVPHTDVYIRVCLATLRVALFSLSHAASHDVPGGFAPHPSLRSRGDFPLRGGPQVRLLVGTT